MTRRCRSRHQTDYIPRRWWPTGRHRHRTCAGDVPPARALRGIRGARGIPAKLVVAGRRRTGSARL